VKAKKEFIVVASLLEKIPNFGHLFRTGEIFGINKLVIPNKNILEDKEFKGISKSGEKWLESIEIKP
jgi:tRNA guanosine-2'-O-methyltransferase